jgi:hypothetical protein
MLKQINHKIEDIIEKVFCDYFPLLFVTIIIGLVLFFLTSCATTPKSARAPHQYCSEEWNVRFITLEGFEVQHKSCTGMDVVTWKVEIWVCEDNEWKNTNLWTVWDGCDYKLIQQNNDNTVDIMGYYENLDMLKKFLKENLYKARVYD